MQLTAEEQHISKWNYETTVVQEIHISRLELQRWPPEFVIYFSNSILYIWDLGLTCLDRPSPPHQAAWNDHCLKKKKI